MNDLLPLNRRAAKGFRLQKLEAYNWGTFDSNLGQVHTVRPDGQTALLVGKNGSGKSTLVDAILTLLVRPGVRNYNVAAGAKKQERDEKTYIKGAFGRLGRDDESRAEQRFLRPGTNHYSALLAYFHDEGQQVGFTVAQLLRLDGEGRVDRLYCFAKEERSIAADFSGITSTDKLKQQLQKRGFQVSDNYPTYHTWIAKLTGLKSQAMDVFNQTVAVKDIQSLNDFIRRHMLESTSWQDKLGRLQTHFKDLSDAHQRLVRVRQQSKLLDPIAETGKSYRQAADDLDHSNRLLAAADSFFRQKTLDLVGPVCDDFRMQLAEELKKRERLTQELAEIDLEHRQLQNEIEQAGGERLRQIPHLIRLAETQSANTRETCRRYQQALEDAEISGEVCDIQRFVEIRETLPQRLDELTVGARKTEKQHEEQLIERATVSRRLAEDEEEFLALNKRQGNLPEFLVTARRQLCADLRLSEKDLPYVAELIAVKVEERGWEASVEMVLRNFALSLLVPRHLYRGVSAYVDRTRLIDANGRGIRLVYLNVGPRTEDVSGPVPSPNSLCRKLEYRDGHSLLPWVKAELEERYNYRCCETIAEFQEAGGLALTRERHAKLHSTRHDKNDRDDASDPRRFVLGWDNRAKRELLAAEIRKLQEEVRSRDRQLDRLREQLAKSRSLQAAIRAALEFEEFSAIDFRFHEKQVADLQLERQRLEESNDKVRVLKKRLAEVNTRKLATESFREESIEKAGALRSKIEDAEKMLATAQRALERRRLAGFLDQDRKEFESLEQQFAAAPLDSISLYNREREFLAERGEAVAKLQQYLEPLRNELLKSMTRYLREFADERADLEADVRSLEDFLRVREQILEDDLPRFEQRFKERLNEKVIQEIAFFHGDLQTESTEITRRIEALNVSLRQLEYSNHSYMRLEPRPTRDPEILAFRNELRQCLAGSFEGSPEADEARFRKIEKLIERLEKEERWRDRVIDVRRWFNFAARELDLETNAEKNYHEDSSGQSGGEKAKLAFTILVASIAYQYDIDVLQPASDRFHFVVVDEMFSKVDDQHAEYALNLFDKFGLQLLIVAPLDAKARVTEPYVGCYLLVAKDDDTNRSEIHSMTAREFEETVAGVG